MPPIGEKVSVEEPLVLCGRGFHVPSRSDHSFLRWIDGAELNTLDHCTRIALVKVYGDYILGGDYPGKECYRSIEVIGFVSIQRLCELLGIYYDRRSSVFMLFGHTSNISVKTIKALKKEMKRQK